MEKRKLQIQYLHVRRLDHSHSESCTVHDWVATPTHQLTVYLQLYSSRSPEYSAHKKWDLSLALIRPSGTCLHITQDHSSPTVLECGPRRYLLSRGVQAVPVNVIAPDSRVARDVDLQCYGAALGDSHCAIHSNHRRHYWEIRILKYSEITQI